MARQSTGPWYRKSKNCWYFWHNGQQTSLGVKGAGSRTEAMQVWARLISGLAMPKKPEPPKQESVVTVDDVVNGYLADAKGRVKENTYATYEGLFALFVGQFTGLMAEEMTTKQILEWLNRPEWGSSHRHNLIGAIQTAFKWSAKSGLISTNPVQDIRRPTKKSRGRQAVISTNDHDKLLASATPALRLLLTLLHETGARPSELAKMTASDIDWKSSVVLLQEHKTAHATNKPRMIVLSDHAKRLLKKQVNLYPTGPLLRNSRGSTWTKDGIGLAIRRARESAGVTAIAYGYRHTFATESLSAGNGDAVVAALLGHSSTTMLHKHYSHLTGEVKVLRAAIKRTKR